LICPYASESSLGRKGYFNSNLESIRNKDVECTFGILKKRWRILDYGFNYYCMKDCEKIFTVCCMLHNMLLGLGETFGYQVIAGRGVPFAGDGLWLEDSVALNGRLDADQVLCSAAFKEADRRDAVLWKNRRDYLAEHLE
jgi:hypothetical protein